MTSTETRPVRRRTQWRKLLTVLTCLLAVPVLLLVLGYAYAYRSAKQELEAEIARIQARGEPINFVDLGRGVPDGMYRNGDRLMAALGRLQKAPEAYRERFDMDPLVPGDYPEFREALDANREALAEIAEIARGGNIRFRYDWNSQAPQLESLESIQGLRQCAWLLSAETWQALGAGDTDRAVAAVMSQFDLAEALSGEPFVVSHLVRIALAGMATSSLESLLAHAELDHAQFHRIDDRLAALRDQFQMAPAIIAERATILTILMNLSQNGLQDDWKTRLYASPLLRPQLYFEQTYALRALTEIADLIDLEDAASADAYDAVDQRIGEEMSRLPLNSIVLPGLTACRTAAMRHRCRLDGARPALRVSRHRQLEGTLPSSLAVVLDDQLTTIPLGLLSHQPLTLTPTENGFAVHETSTEQGSKEFRIEVTYPSDDVQESAAP